MKKLLLIAFSLTLVLAGCGQKTPYEELKANIKDLNKADAINMVIGSTITGTDSDLDGTNFELGFTFDLNQDLIKVDVNEVQMYLTNDTLYMNVLNTWLQKSFDITQYSEIQEALSYKDVVLDLPAGDTPITDNYTGIKTIDEKISGKTLNDIVVSTGTNTYSIEGLEDILTIDTTDGVSFQLNDKDAVSGYIKFIKADKVTLPDEAKNAKSMDDLGASLDSVLGSSN